MFVDLTPLSDRRICDYFIVNNTGLAVVLPPQTLRTDTYFSRLVFEDTFGFLDTNKWDYEVTAGGGGGKY